VRIQRVFNSAELAAGQQLVRLALEEDLAAAGDLTSQAVVPAELSGRAAFTARAAGVVAGLPAAALVVAAVSPQLTFVPVLIDGARVEAGTRLAVISGPMRALLTAERTALNFLQRLSGVATQTRAYVDRLAGLPARVLDTRKTTPGWRLLEKYAVRCGGGHNHRNGLYDGILIKDNHLACLPAATRAEAVRRAVAAARAAGYAVPIEVEVEDLEQLDAALEAQAELVLLDNMPPDLLRAAVRRRDAAAPATQLEASGGITLATLRAIAETGVDRISVGALTHSAVALDVALDYLPS